MNYLQKLLLIFIVLPSVSFAMCPQQPRHFYTLNVTSCESVRFNKTDGITLKGIVLKNKYDWGNKKQWKVYDPWKINEVKSVYLKGVSKEYCKRKAPFILYLEEINRCCDTRPARGDCLLPRMSWFSVEQ